MSQDTSTKSSQITHVYFTLLFYVHYVRTLLPLQSLLVRIMSIQSPPINYYYKPKFALTHLHFFFSRLVSSDTHVRTRRNFCFARFSLYENYENVNTLSVTCGGLQPQPGKGSPSGPSGHGASSPGTPWSPLLPLSPFLPRLPGGPCAHTRNASSL